MKVLDFWESLDIVTNSKQPLITKLQCCWSIYQTLTLLPMLILNIFRFFSQLKNEDYIDNKKEMPSYKTEKFVKLYAWGYVLFYVPDMILLFPGLIESCKICKLCFFIHHFFSLYGAYVILQMSYMPWFIMAPLTFHSVLIMYPHITDLNYVYLISILLSYYGCMQKPYLGRLSYERVKFYILLLAVPVAGMWLFSCTNHISLE